MSTKLSWKNWRKNLIWHPWLYPKALVVKTFDLTSGHFFPLDFPHFKIFWFLQYRLGLDLGLLSAPLPLLLMSQLHSVPMDARIEYVNKTAQMRALDEIIFQSPILVWLGATFSEHLGSCYLLLVASIKLPLATNKRWIERKFYESGPCWT